MVTTPQTFNCVTHTPLPLQDRGGGVHCYNCIIETFQGQAYNLAYRMLNDWAMAEDAVQESLVSGYRAFSQFRGENLKAWLMRIVANTCRDMHRARRARPTTSLDPLPTSAEDPTPSAADLPSELESPEDHAERAELRQAITDGLAALSEDRRLAVLLVDVQGFSYEEAAQVMRCSLGTLKSRISRGRGDLRDFLREAGELLPSRFRQDQ